MNKFHYFLLAGLMCLPFVSCKNTVAEYYSEGENGSDGTTKVVKLSFNEEQFSSSENPMTRAGGDEAGKRYYAINVYQKVDSSYQKLAYGLFDTPDDMSVLLEEGRKYKFECIEIKNNEDTVYHDGNFYYHPFKVGNQPGEITNTFVRSNFVNNDEMASGIFSFSKNARDSTKYPRVYTYYGTADDFDPATSGNVDISLRRAVFGLHFKITPPKDGTAHLVFLNNWTIDISAGDQPYDKGSIYSFHTIKDAVKDGYNGNVTLRTTWTYSDGTVKNDTYKIHVTRNTTTTVNLDFSGATESGITITEENDEFGSENVSHTVK